jgi:hypothetical protein
MRSQCHAGRQIAPIADARAYIFKLKKADQESVPWQAAGEALFSSPIWAERPANAVTPSSLSPNTPRNGGILATWRS